MIFQNQYIVTIDYVQIYDLMSKVSLESTLLVDQKAFFCSTIQINIFH